MSIALPGIRAAVLTPRGGGLVTAGLLAHYLPALDGSGQVVGDRSGNGKHGQLGATNGSDTTDPTWVAAGLSFDGTDDYVNIDALSVYNNGSGAFAALVVIKGVAQSDKRLWGEGNTGSVNPIVSLGSGPVATSKGRFYVRDAAGVVQVQADTTATVFDNTWHSLGITDNNGAWQFYVDGLPDASGSYTRPVMTLDKRTLGALGRGTYGSFFVGSFAAAPFYGRALSAAEVLQNHRQYKAALAPYGVTLP